MWAGSALKRVAFWQLLLWAAVFARLWYWLNAYTLLPVWGARIRVGGFLIRSGFVSAKVWMYNIGLVVFAVACFLISMLAFRWLMRKSGGMTPAIRALLFSWVLTAGAYFFCVMEINNRLPYFFSSESLRGNGVLLAAFLLLGAGSFLITWRLNRYIGVEALLDALAFTRGAVLLRRGLLAACLAGLACFLVLERNISLKYMVYRKGDRAIGKSLRLAGALLDFDGDGYGFISLIRDPYPFDASRGVMAVDVPCNGVDEDGIGGDSLDADGDGFERGLDCDDGDARIHPRALEVPNKRDDNCDGVIDNLAPGVFPVENSPLIARARRLSEEGRLLVLIACADSLRADHLGVLGYERETTPVLDGLARESVLFARAYSPGTGTKSSVPSIFLSVQPCLHRMQYHDFMGSTEGKEIPSLAEVLRSNGYFTAYLASHHFDEEQEMLEGGFNLWRDAKTLERAQVNASDMRDEFYRALEESPAGNRLFYLHFLEPHMRYDELPSPYRDMFGSLPGAVEFYSPTREDFEFMKLEYDRRLAFVDSEFGRLFDSLKERGLWDDTLLVVSSDHGDEFGEHGCLYHLSSLYDEQVRVPLIVHFPGQKEGSVVTQPVQLLDLMPTVLEVAGLEIPPTAQGSSLLPVVAGGDDVRLHEYIFLENTWGKEVFKLGVVHRNYKYVYDFYTGEDYLFDLEADPEERVNLIEEMPDLRYRLRKVLFNHKSALELIYRGYPSIVPEG